METFEGFFGNSQIAAALADLVERGRIPQTLLFSGPEGIGKATLARKFAAKLLADTSGKIARDDLSLPANQQIITEREKWPADKRNDDPLFFNSHPDFVTFAPEGPLRQISIPQMRLLKQRAQLKPLHGEWRVFLIDGIDRANEQAANSLLKTLEEPPSHLILILTARNPYDLLPTIRSRVVPFLLGRLTDAEMQDFLKQRDLDQINRRTSLAEGSPGQAVSLDLENYDRRREAMLTLLEVAAGISQFSAWIKHADSIAARRTEKLEAYLETLYILLEDVLRLMHGGSRVRNADAVDRCTALSRRVSFAWVRRAVGRVDEMAELARRSIQKTIALDAFASSLRP